MSRLLKPKEGAVVLEGKSIAKLLTKAVARKPAILPKSSTAPEGLTVLKLGKQGRFPHQSWLKQWSDEVEAIVNRALEATRMVELKDRPEDELSGGQRQREWIAMTLAQDNVIILCDMSSTTEYMYTQ